MAKNYTFKLFDEEDEFVDDFCFNDYLDLCNTISSLEDKNARLNKAIEIITNYLELNLFQKELLDSLRNLKIGDI